MLAASPRGVRSTCQLLDSGSREDRPVSKSGGLRGHPRPVWPCWACHDHSPRLTGTTWEAFPWSRATHTAAVGEAVQGVQLCQPCLRQFGPPWTQRPRPGPCVYSPSGSRAKRVKASDHQRLFGRRTDGQVQQPHSADSQKRLSHTKQPYFHWRT